MNAPDNQLMTIIQHAELPKAVRKVLETAGEIESESISQSWLLWLDTQIELAARGPEWINLYKARRRNLTDFAKTTLTRASALVGSTSATAYIDPTTHEVIHWELLNDDGIDCLEK
jgi:hypothetical protein